MSLRILAQREYDDAVDKHGARRWYGVPGAFVLGGVTYCPRSVALAAADHRGWQRTLLVHEKWHEHDLPDHPTNPVGAIAEAVKYGCDERAFTRFLRLRRSKRYLELEREVLDELDALRVF